MNGQEFDRKERIIATARAIFLAWEANSDSACDLNRIDRHADYAINLATKFEDACQRFLTPPPPESPDEQ